MCFCVLLYFTACMLYYCNTVGWAWWDWGLIWWLTVLLQCFDTVGWVTWPVKILSPNDLYCVEWDVKPYPTTTTTSKCTVCHSGASKNRMQHSGTPKHQYPHRNGHYQNGHSGPERHILNIGITARHWKFVKKRFAMLRRSSTKLHSAWHITWV